MPVRPHEPDFTQKDIATDQDFPIPDIGDNLAQTLAHLIGFFQQENRFKLLRVDNQGRLHVTPGAVATNNWVLTQFTPLGNNATQIVWENVERRELYIHNEGFYSTRLHRDGTVNANVGLLIPSGGSFHIDTYYGDLWCYCINGGNKLTVVEIR